MATGSSVTRNINSIRRNIRNMSNEVKEKTAEAMGMIVNDLVNKAKQLAPLDTGDLRGSGEGKVIKSANKIRGEVSFNKPYALKQHEDMSLNHPRGGQAKYLEQPLNENRDRYKKFVADKIREATGDVDNNRR